MALDDRLPKGIEAQLDALGVRRVEEPCKPANPWKDYVAWKPTHPGEEPPF
jgi:hypothetical protein